MTLSRFRLTGACQAAPVTWFIVLGSFAAGFAFAPGTARDVMRLNELLAPTDGSDAFSPAVTPDGTRVVYVANDARVSTQDVFVAPIDGSEEPICLSSDDADLAGGIFILQISPDGTRVVYARKNGPYDYELYSASTDGTLRTLLAESVNPDFSLTPGGTRVLYRSEANREGVPVLLSIPVDGGPALPFHGPFDTTRAFAVDPDSARVLSVTRVEGRSHFELYSAPLDMNTDPIRISGPPVDDVIEVVAQAGMAFYSLEKEGTESTYYPTVDRLYSAPIDGSRAAVRLAGPMPDGRAILDFKVAPDAQHVVYRADEDTDDVWELYGVPADGSLTPVKLNGTLVEGGHVLGPYRFTPNSVRVVYHADQDIDETEELYSASVSWGVAVKLNDDITGNGSVGSDFLITPAGCVIYSAGETQAIRDLFSVPDDGSVAPTRIAPEPGQSGRVWRLFDVSPDGASVTFSADYDGGSRDLHSVPVDGSAAPTRLSQASHPWSATSEVVYTPDGSTVIFRGDPDTRGVIDVYAVPADGSAPSARLSDEGALVSTGVVGQVSVTPDGQHVVYQAEQDTADRWEISSVPVDGSDAPVRLNHTLDATEDVFQHVISPDGEWVLFTVNQNNTAAQDLFSVPLDGSAQAVQLNGLEPLKLSTPEIATDSSTAFFVAGGELFSAPIDGSGPAEALDDDQPEFTSLGGFTLSPDGSSIVYRADRTSDGAYELWVVPSDGSADPVRLSDPLRATADVGFFKIDPIGTWVAYRADRDTSGVDQLFYAPLDGSQSPVEIIPGSTQGTLGQFEMTADGSRVVYLTGSHNHLDLYSAELGQPDSATRLNTPFDGSGHVGSFELSHDGQWVVFRPNTDYQWELFAAPVDGSAPPHKLSQPLAEYGDVYSFEISADDRHVVFTASDGVAQGAQLFSVPLDGRRKPVRLNPEPARGGVQAFRISDDSCRVAYVAEQDTEYLSELYSVPIVGGTAPIKVRAPLGAETLSDGFAQLPWATRLLFRAGSSSPSWTNTDLFSAALPIQMGTVSPEHGGLGGGNTVTLLHP